MSSEISIEILREERKNRNDAKADELYLAVLDSMKKDNEKGLTSTVYIIDRDSFYCIKELKYKLKKRGFYCKTRSRRCFTDSNEIHLMVNWGSSYNAIIIKRLLAFSALAIALLYLVKLIYLE